MDGWLDCARLILATEPLPRSWRQLSGSAKFVRQAFRENPELFASANAVSLGAMAAAIDRRPWNPYGATDYQDRLRHNMRIAEPFGTIAGHFIEAGRMLTKQNFLARFDRLSPAVHELRDAAAMALAEERANEVMERMRRENIPAKPPSVVAILSLVKEKNGILPEAVARAIRKSYRPFP